MTRPAKTRPPGPAPAARPAPAHHAPAFLPPLCPRRRLLLALSIALAAWAAVLLYLYFRS